MMLNEEESSAWSSLYSSTLSRAVAPVRTCICILCYLMIVISMLLALCTVLPTSAERAKLSNSYPLLNPASQHY